MNKSTIWGIVVLILIIGGVWLGQKPNISVDGESIKIGMISILSGEYSVVGENFKNGAILAQEEYNQKNPNQQISFVAEDDGFDSKKALSAYYKLTGVDQINALINVSTPSIGAVYDLVTKTRMPVIQGGEQPTEPSDDNVFQIMPGNIEVEKQLGKYIKEGGYKKPVVVYTKHDTMIRFKDAMISGFGGSMPEFSLNADEKDLATHALKVAQEKPDVLILLVFPQQGAQFVKEYVTIQNKLPQLAFDANVQSGISDYQRILGNNARILDGSIVSAINQTVTEEFKKSYRERFNADAGFMSDFGYDAFNLLVESYDPDGGEWIENVKNAHFTGVSGLIQFDDVGVRTPEVKIVKIVDGQILTQGN